MFFLSLTSRVGGGVVIGPQGGATKSEGATKPCVGFCLGLVPWVVIGAQGAVPKYLPVPVWVSISPKPFAVYLFGLFQ